jgi:hypothetical protein
MLPEILQAVLCLLLIFAIPGQAGIIQMGQMVIWRCSLMSTGELSICRVEQDLQR